MTFISGENKFDTLEEVLNFWDSKRTWKDKLLSNIKYYFWSKWVSLFKTVNLYIVSFYQRGRRGWSMQDTWSFDFYLSNVISDGCRYLAKTSQGYPSGLSAEKWNDILIEIASGFDEYKKVLDFEGIDGDISTKDFSKLNDERMEKFNHSWDLFKQYFGNLWD